MEPELRQSIFQALVLLRNRSQLDPVVLINLCFHLFRCQDKTLRTLVFNHIIVDVKNVNKMASNIRLNKAIQNLVYEMLEDPSPMAAKKSLQVMIELYKRRIWTDERTVNVIASACFSTQEKARNMVIAIHFFLGIDEQIDLLLEEEEEDMTKQKIKNVGEKGKNLEEIQKKRKVSRNHSRRTRARKRKEEKIDKALKKAQRLKNGTAEAKRIAAPRFPAIELINDPQGFAERLFKKLKSSTESFDVRLSMMNLISRVLGFHKLLLLPYFSFLQRYLQPHQRSVTNVLAFLIQASHDLVPSEEVEPIIKLIANNFVTDRSGPEVMAVGLNAIRELVVRIPLLTSGDGMQDLVNDLIQYRRYRRDKSVVMAARGLLNFIRETNPTILARKERGKFHDATAKPLEYGQVKVLDGVEGAELLKNEAENNPEENSDEEGKEDDTKMEDASGEPVGDSTAETARVDKVRILTEKDFRRIRKLKEKQEQEKRNPRARRKRARGAGVIQNALMKNMNVSTEDLEEGTSEEEEIEDYLSASDGDNDNDDERQTNDGVVNPHDLEGHVKRQRRELADRLRSVYAGREGAHRLANKRLGGTNNLEKSKAKNYQMVQHSKRVREKQYSSLRQQQYQLRKHIKNLERKKKTVQRIRRRTNKTS